VLGQAAYVNPDRVGVAHAPDPLGGEDVDHAGREAAIRNHGDAALLRVRVQGLLFEDDLGVAP
jgi:hypothetical protein